jgi:A/G-specific adenine glycosylase
MTTATQPLSPPAFRKRVLQWFKKHGRTNLPWQKNNDPYRIWLSEIMLQQTQVSTVIDYFQRFVTQFPTVKSLAEAPEDAVLALWSGLGYYQRARNLHRCAQIIMTKFLGHFPSSVDALQTLPGIGRSTAGAIAAFSFEQRAAILDGNVKRVLSRFAGIAGWPGETKVHQTLWELAEQYTPHQHIAQYTQAMMDLGATLCVRSKPHCTACPLQSACFAYQQHAIAEYPGKRPTKIIPLKHETWLILMDAEQRIIMQKRPPTGVWGSLWVFPTFKGTSLKTWCRTHLSCEILTKERWPTFRHTFSHFQLDITPIFATIAHTVGAVMETSSQHCYNLDAALLLGVPSPVKQCLKRCENKLCV